MPIIKVNTNILFLVLIFFTLVAYSNFAVSASSSYSRPNTSTINDSEHDKSKNKHFPNYFINKGTITDSQSTGGGGFLAEASFTNEGSISITKYLTEFQATLTNAKTGIILAASRDQNYIGLKVIGAVSNTGSITTGINTTSTITWGGITLFHSEVTNSGTIITKGSTFKKLSAKGDFPDIGLEVTGTVYNLLEGSISVYSGKALFYNKLLNKGYLVIKDSDKVQNAEIDTANSRKKHNPYNNISLVVEGTVLNFARAHIEIHKGKFLLQNELSNSGIISANGYAATKTFAALEVTGRAYNAGTITAGSHKLGKILLAKELINKGIIDSQGCQYIFMKGAGSKNRKSTIGFEVSGTAYNFKQSSISVAIGKALFRSELTNSGTIFAFGKHKDEQIGLEVSGTVYNAGSITVTKGSALFRSELTNSGTIFSSVAETTITALEVGGTVNNSGSITVGINRTSTSTLGGITLFHSDVTNSGTIITKGTTRKLVGSSNSDNTGLEVTGTVYNLLGGNISVQAGKALFHNKLSNKGYLIVKGSDRVENKNIPVSVPIFSNISLVVEGTVSNFTRAHIEISKGKFLLQNELSNSGVISANGYAATNTFAALDVAGRAYNAGIITVGSNTDKAGAILFAKELINKGIIDSRGCHYIFPQNIKRKATIGLEVSGTAYNYKQASISVAIGKALFHGELTNSGTIFAFGKHKDEHIALEVSGTVYNAGSITVTKGSALCNSELTNTQTGVIIASGFDTNHIGLEVTGTLYNAGSITITKGDFKLHNHATNDGYIEASKTVLLPAGKNIANKGYFAAASITFLSQAAAAKSASYFYNQTENAVAKFNAVVNEPYLNIENQGSLSLMGSTTIGSYIGNATSELVLTLPSSKPKSLLAVTNNATFDDGAKIILAAENNSFLGAATKTITIIQAKSITTNGSMDNLLYSRAYYKNYATIKTGQHLRSNSILIRITDATKTSTEIKATLQKGMPAALDFSLTKLKLTDSLLKNKIVSAASESVAVVPKIIIIKTADPQQEYIYNRKNHNILIGETSPTHTPTTIYGTQTSDSAVEIGFSYLNKIDFVADVIGAISPTVNINQDAVLIHKVTSTIVLETNISKGVTIRGTKGINITKNMISNIINYGTIEGITHAIYFNDDSCVLDGTLTNNNIIKGGYALYNSLGGATGFPDRMFVICNNKTGIITGSITISGTASLVNYGTVEATDIKIANIVNFGSITHGYQQKTLHLIGEVSNSGIILAQGKDNNGIGLEVSGTVYNSKEGSISIALGKTLLHNSLKNDGTFIACGTDATGIALEIIGNVNNTGKNTLVTYRGQAKISGEVTNTGAFTLNGNNAKGVGLEVSGTFYNTGSLTITKGSALFNSELTNTQTGVIIASGLDANNIGLEITGTLYNYGSITITKGYFKLHNHTTNEGHIEASKTVLLPAEKNITNKGYFEAASITVLPKISSKSYSYFYNQTENAVAKFNAVVNEPYLNVDNQGSLSLMGSSTIGSYIGNATSELVLTLPTIQAQATTPTLLRVTNHATFDYGAKIILAIDANPFLSSSTTTVHIVTAKTLTIVKPSDELLYSRVYENGMQKVKYDKKTAPTLKPGSQFIHIAEVKQGKVGADDYLDAKLRLVQPTTSQVQHHKLIRSLLNNALYGKPRPVAVKVVSKSASNLASKKTPLGTHQATKYDSEYTEIEYYKPLHNHFRLTSHIIENYTIELKHQLQTPTKLSFDSKNTLWSSIGSYSGTYKAHKWQEMQLCIGNEIEVNDIKISFTFAYLDTKISTDNQPKTKLHSYHAVAHLMKYIDNICINSGFIYGRTNHKKNSITKSKHTDEVSVVVTANYKYIADGFNIDLGINSRFMNIHSSKKTIDTKSNKAFISLGTFIRIATVTKLADIIAHVSLYGGYDYTGNLTNNKTTTANIVKTKFNNHMLFTKLRAHIDYHAWFYNLLFHYSHATKQNIYGCNMAVGYKF